MREQKNELFRILAAPFTISTIKWFYNNSLCMWIHKKTSKFLQWFQLRRRFTCFLYDFHSHKQPKMIGAMISIQENKSHKVFLALAHVLKRSCGKFVKTSSLHIIWEGILNVQRENLSYGTWSVLHYAVSVIRKEVN